MVTHDNIHNYIYTNEHTQQRNKRSGSGEPQPVRERKERDKMAKHKTTITLNLEPIEASGIAIRAAKMEKTTGELLETFIRDLIRTEADEDEEETAAEELANRYYECRKEMGDYPQHCSFFSSLFDSEFYSTIANCMQVAGYYREKEAIEGDLLPDEKLEMEAEEAAIMAYYNAYKEAYGARAQSLEQGLEAVRRFENDRNHLMYDSDMFIAYLNGVYGALSTENKKKPGSADEKIKLLRAVRDNYKRIKEGEV